MTRRSPCSDPAELLERLDSGREMALVPSNANGTDGGSKIYVYGIGNAGL
jgi:hypothetical protein